jgi:hypothetical protein
MVPGDLSPDPDRARHLQHRTGPSSRRDPVHRLEDQTQAEAGHARARCHQTSDRPGRDRRRLSRRRAVRRQTRSRDAGKTAFVDAVETTDEGKPVWLKLRRPPAFVQLRSTGSPSSASIQTAPNFKASALRGAKGSSGPTWNASSASPARTSCTAICRWISSGPRARFWATPATACRAMVAALPRADRWHIGVRQCTGTSVTARPIRQPLGPRYTRFACHFTI